MRELAIILCATMDAYGEKQHRKASFFFLLIGLQEIFCQSMAGGKNKNKNKIPKLYHRR